MTTVTIVALLITFTFGKMAFTDVQAIVLLLVPSAGTVVNQ